MVRFSDVIQAAAGETQIIVDLPEPVPEGKVLNLRIEISGSYGEAVSVETETVSPS